MALICTFFFFFYHYTFAYSIKRKAECCHTYGVMYTKVDLENSGLDTKYGIWNLYEKSKKKENMFRYDLKKRLKHEPYSLLKWN